MNDLLRALMGGSGGPQDAKEDPLSNLLAGLMGNLAGQQPTADNNPLAALLGADARQPADDAVSGLAAEAQVSPAVVQAIIALLIGRLVGQEQTKTGDVDLSALLTEAGSSGEVDEVALRSSGLPQALVGTTGLDLPSAIRVLQKLLPALAGLLKLPGVKPTAKPKPAASTAKPKPASGTAKPKPAASTAKPRPRKSEGIESIDLGEVTGDE